MATIVVAGLVCVDLAPRLPASPACTPGSLTEVGELTITPGGCVGNTGPDLAAMGARVRLAADVGSDELGRLLIADLAALGCDVSGIREVPGGRTSYSVVIQPPNEDRAFWHHVGSNAEFDGSTVDLTGVELLHVGYPTLLPALAADGGRAMVELFTRARREPTTTSLDLAALDPEGSMSAHDWVSWLRRVLPLTDVLTPSVEDLKGTLVGFDETPDPLRSAEALLALGAAVVLLTAGDDGMYVVTAGADRLGDAGPAFSSRAEAWSDLRLHIAAAEVPVRTTNGAGDAAAAGFLYAAASGADPRDALRLAAAAAAHRISGMPRLPAFTGVSQFCRPVHLDHIDDLASPPAQEAIGVA